PGPLAADQHQLQLPLTAWENRDRGVASRAAGGGVMIRILLMATALAALAPTAQAQDITERSERLQLEGRRGPSLLRPGFAVGEYEGVASTRSSSTRILG